MSGVYLIVVFVKLVVRVEKIERNFCNVSRNENKKCCKSKLAEATKLAAFVTDELAFARIVPAWQPTPIAHPDAPLADALLTQEGGAISTAAVVELAAFKHDVRRVDAKAVVTAVRGVGLLLLAAEHRTRRDAVIEESRKHGQVVIRALNTTISSSIIFC